MSASSRNELRETTLVLADRDIFVKHRRAYRNLTGSLITGERFTTTLPILNAQAKDKIGELQTTIKKEGKTTIIDYQYRRPINPREIAVSELSLLIQDSFIKRIGDLRIIDWPKEDLSDIHFLHTKPFFVSAMGEIEGNTISPLSGFKSIISHARKGKSIRIEYIQKTKPLPTLIWRDEYYFHNDSDEEAIDCELKFLVPRNDQKQRVNIKTNTTISLEQDKDGNAWAKVNIPKFRAYEKIRFVFNYKITKEPYQFSNDYGKIQFLKSLAVHGSIGHHFLNETPLWPVNDKKVQKVAQRILEGQTNIFEIVKLIFEFVNQSFKYEINGERLPADEILRTRKGDCSEFSDLFVTLARACGIPARVCTGFFWHQSNKIEGHAWCEVFTKLGWIPLDPLHGFLHGVSFQHILFAKESNDVDYPAYILKSIGGDIRVERNYSISIH
ncbi:MAG: transglutaminase-like domain-containing protein [Candidatus Heimdallarchaeaceae archaeon]